MTQPSTRATVRRASAAGLVAAVLFGLLSAPVAVAADPSAGFDADWTVTRPDGSLRAGGAIAVGDDLSLAFQAVDGTPTTACRIRVNAFGGGLMESPGVIDDGVCRLSLRLPDFPDPEERLRMAAEPSDVALDLCVWVASITFSDGLARSMAAAVRGQPGGRACANWVSGIEPQTLDFRIEEGGTRRPFQSSPFLVSWDPADWGTGMTPMRFGEEWHVELPPGLDRCSVYLNGDSAHLRPRAADGCQPWDVRIPGVLPPTVPWEGDLGDWSFQTVIDYTVSDPGPGSWTISHARTPMATSDGVFQSSLAAIFPTDLARARFVTAGERWQPAFQVSGATATNCRMTYITIPPTWPEDDLISEDFDVVPDADGVCTFDLDPIPFWESHQYRVTPTLASGDDPNLSYGTHILSIAPPEPPVIDPPVLEPDGETGIDVEPGDGQGLVVDLEVVPTTELSAAAVAALDPVCTGRARSTDMSSGGSIPRLETSCGLPPGTYRATATMVDAAGTSVTSERSFSVLAPRPQVTGRSPGPAASGVARDVKPTVVFDIPVKGVTSASFRLRDTATGSYLPASVGYNTSTRRATLSPGAALVAGRTYRLYLTSGITSVAASRPLAALDWTFRVSTDATRPSIVGRTPAPGATGVARTANVAVRFSEPVRGVTTSTFQLRDTVTGQYVAGSVSYDAGAYRASFAPASTLVGGRTYQAIVRYGIRDRAGISIMTSSWTFKTRP